MSEKKKPTRSTSTNNRDKLAGRDTIFIDTEDDITSIIEKVKESDSSILALVPPKRVGVLQSVVNLKLLQKAAKSSGKKIALVTTDAALIALAAGLRIPVAKNLASQPELPEAPDIDDTDIDVINGEELAIGDLARVDERPISWRNTSEDKEISAAVKAIETDDRIKNDVDADGESDNKPKKLPKDRLIPNFDDFRKKILIFGTLGLALIVFLVWAIVFAPHGTIIITAETVSKNVEVAVALKPNAVTDVNSNVIQSVIKQIKKTESEKFSATGSQEVGDRATGVITIYNCQFPFDPYSGISNSITLKAGTTVATSGGLQFTLDSQVTIDAMLCTGGVNTKGKDASVTASSFGEKYNIAGDTPISVAGYGSKLSAAAKGDFSGGTSRTVTVVQQSDIDAVTEKLKNKGDKSSIENELTAQMGNDMVIVSGSFNASYGDIISKPDLGGIVDSGDATATMEIVYTLIGIRKNDLDSVIRAQLGDLSEQKIYDNGISKVQFNKLTPVEDDYTVTIKTTAQIGPDLEKRKNQIIENAVGKRSGEIVSDIEAIPGVSSVKVTFSPFWVSTAPAANKLKVEFTVNE